MHPIYPIISGGLLTFALVRICPRPLPPPCPKISWKHILATIFGLGGGIIYFVFVGFKTFTEGIHFFNAHIAAIALGCAVYVIFCPYE